MVDLTPELASRCASTALGHVTREYPNKLDHVLRGPHDLRGPRALHPIFYGSFDWHSCVHGYWLLCTLLRRFPALSEAARIRALLDEHVTPANVAAELRYADELERGTFERPYGWAWLLMLAAEFARDASDDGRRRASVFAPLADGFARRFTTFLPNATYPVRAGTHASSAFALALAIEYARVAGDPALDVLLCNKARTWFANDADNAAWEPGGDDFLSPALVEAECMRRALPKVEFAQWLARFLPRLHEQEPATLFRPAVVSDRTDGKIVHLDGLNLSRAWCMRAIASALDEHDARRTVLLDAAVTHVSASLRHVAGDYMGEHWLATFAVLALTAQPAGAGSMTPR